MKLADAQTLTPITGPVNLGESHTKSIENLITTTIGFLTIVGGIAFLIWFIIGAYSWITAEGKPDKLEKARNHLTQAITGLVILVGAYAITGLIATILGLQFFDLTQALSNLVPKTLQSNH